MKGKSKRDGLKVNSSMFTVSSSLYSLPLLRRCWVKSWLKILETRSSSYSYLSLDRFNSTPVSFGRRREEKSFFFTFIPAVNSTPCDQPSSTTTWNPSSHPRHMNYRLLMKVYCTHSLTHNFTRRNQRNERVTLFCGVSFIDPVVYPTTSFLSGKVPLVLHPIKWGTNKVNDEREWER